MQVQSRICREKKKSFRENFTCFVKKKFRENFCISYACEKCKHFCEKSFKKDKLQLQHLRVLRNISLRIFRFIHFREKVKKISHFFAKRFVRCKPYKVEQCVNQFLLFFISLQRMKPFCLLPESTLYKMQRLKRVETINQTK